ncbi:ABC transporter ATP-binding protein [Pelomicrobium sp. G1]|uniref:ABC transporter ATP-binding protein n=1 Tax=unclassified Pelomicrobium TaxID=2815318 RepID=UPI003F7681E1
MAKVIVDDLSLRFRVYHEWATSAKEYFANLFRRRKRQAYSDFWALREVSFAVKDGERVGIVGRNGAGKSTLLKTICRIYEPTAGKVTVNGRIAPLLEIGAGFHPEFTGRENIYFNGTILGYSKEQVRAIEEEVISFAELEEFIDTPVKYYSTGMYMRLAFSLATAVHPDILVLDELFAGGDAEFVKRGKERMYRMIDRASVMILVSHDESLLRSLCSRFIWLDHGRIVADGNVSVLDRYMNA